MFMMRYSDNGLAVQLIWVNAEFLGASKRFPWGHEKRAIECGIIRWNSITPGIFFLPKKRAGFTSNYNANGIG